MNVDSPVSTDAASVLDAMSRLVVSGMLDPAQVETAVNAACRQRAGSGGRQDPRSQAATSRDIRELAISVGLLGEAVDGLRQLLKRDGEVSDRLCQRCRRGAGRECCSVIRGGEPPAAGGIGDASAAGEGPQCVGPFEVSRAELVEGTPVVDVVVDGAHFCLTEIEADALAGHLGSVARAIRRSHFPTP